MTPADHAGHLGVKPGVVELTSPCAASSAGELIAMRARIGRQIRGTPHSVLAGQPMGHFAARHYTTPGILPPPAPIYLFADKVRSTSQETPALPPPNAVTSTKTVSGTPSINPPDPLR